MLEATRVTKNDREEQQEHIKQLKQINKHNLVQFETSKKAYYNQTNTTRMHKENQVMGNFIRLYPHQQGPNDAYDSFLTTSSLFMSGLNVRKKQSDNSNAAGKRKH